MTPIDLVGADVPGTGMAGVTLAAAFAYVALAGVSHVRRAPIAMRSYVVALLATGLWLALSAIYGLYAVHAQLGEAARNLGWLWFMAAVAGRRDDNQRISPLGWVYIGLFGVQGVIASLLLVFVTLLNTPPVFFGPALASLQMLFAAGALVLVHNLFEAGRGEDRRALTLPLAAMGVMWAYDLNLSAIGYLSDEPASLLLHLRPLLAWLLLAMLAIAALRPGGKAVRLSRPAAFRSVGVAAVAVWLSLLAFMAALVR
jgi:hypothetical protein